MTQIMIAHEKHGTRYFDMSMGIGNVAKALLKERLDAGFWYYDNDKVRAEKALSGENPKFTPWHFLAGREHYEYERVEIVDLEQMQTR